MPDEKTVWFSTSCPQCEADVFFLRHNGGSVWLDEMGYPWPRHGCFPRTRKEHEIPIEKLFASLPKSDDFDLFKVQATIYDESSKARFIVLVTAGGIQSLWRALSGAQCAYLTGGVVAFDTKTKVIVDWDGDSFAVIGPFESCPHCNRHLLPEVMAEHVRTTHPMRRCHRCGQRVELLHWDDHQEEHLGPRIRNL